MTKVILSWSELKAMLKEQFKASALSIDEDANVTMEIDINELKKREIIYQPQPYPVIINSPYRHPYPHFYITTSTTSKLPQVTFSSSSK